jgi:hypothetical protein
VPQSSPGSAKIVLLVEYEGKGDKAKMELSRYSGGVIESGQGRLSDVGKGGG